MGILSRLFGTSSPAPARDEPALPPRFGLPELARWLQIDADRLQAIKPRYHEFRIPKKKSGTRRILAPADDLKHIQRLLLRRVFARLRAHPAATGFERGHSIATNALHHVGRAVVIRMDIVNFFSSTRADRIESYFRAIGWDRPATDVLVRLTTHDGSLPQGAPTSPRLSNLVNWRLDARLAAFAARSGGAYTRYADDLTLSCDVEFRPGGDSVFRFTERVLRDFGYSIHQRRKRSVRRRHQQQRVTGLIVNDGVNLPRDVRRRLRAIEHRLATGQPATLTPDQLRGWRAHEHMVRAVRAR